MSRNQHDSPESPNDERGDQIGDDRVKGLLHDRQGAWERQVVARAAHPDRRRHECVQPLGQLAGEMVPEQRVGGQWHVASVLLGGAEGDHNRVPAGAKLGLHLGPGQLVELDGGHRQARR